MDFQPGLYIVLKKTFFQLIKLKCVKSQIGDFHLIDTFYEKGAKIYKPQIQTRTQTTTSIKFEDELSKIKQLEAYFKIKFPELIEKIRKNPQKYLRATKIADLDFLLKYYKDY